MTCATAIRLTMSFGVASFPAHGETAGSLLRAADDALCAAKQSGRDRSVLHSQTLPGAARPDGQPRDIAGERFVAVVLDLAEAVDLRFSGSARHSETVGRYAATMAEELGLSTQRIERVRLAGMLHDVGKVGVPDSILNKPAPLTEEEYRIIKRHPELGAQILEHPSLADVRKWVAAHHERPDGRGYPRGLSGEQLPLEARIVAVADAYEAMTTDRAYRRSLGPDAARAELQRCSGSQFDAAVVKALLTVLEREADEAEAVLAGLGRLSARPRADRLAPLAFSSAPAILTRRGAPVESGSNENGLRGEHETLQRPRPAWRWSAGSRGACSDVNFGRSAARTCGHATNRRRERLWLRGL